MADEIHVFTKEGSVPAEAGIGIFVPPSLLPAFKELVFRGTNLWPDAKPEIKDFADILHHGRPLQDYKGQDTSKEVSALEQTFMKDSFL